MAQIVSHNNLAKATNNFLLYENPAVGIRLTYPANWTVTPGHGNVSAVFSNNNSRYTGISVIVDKLAKNITLDNFIESRINQLKKTNFDPMGLFNYLTKHVITSKGYPATRLEYQYVCSADESVCYAVEVWTISCHSLKNDKIYGFTSNTVYRSGINIFDSQFLKTEQKMIDSFEITK